MRYRDHDDALMEQLMEELNSDCTNVQNESVVFATVRQQFEFIGQLIETETEDDFDDSEIEEKVNACNELQQIMNFFTNEFFEKFYDSAQCVGSIPDYVLQYFNFPREHLEMMAASAPVFEQYFAETCKAYQKYQEITKV